LRDFVRIFENVFSGKVVILGFKEFYVLHDDLKIIPKKLTPGRYPVQKTKNTGIPNFWASFKTLLFKT